MRMPTPWSPWPTATGIAFPGLARNAAVEWLHPTHCTQHERLQFSVTPYRARQAG